MIAYRFLLALVSLLFVFSAATAAPSYIGPYKYYSERCGPTYGPFDNETVAAETAASKEYSSGCSVTLVSHYWATPTKSVSQCGGGWNYPTYVEGVEKENWADYKVKYYFGAGCSASADDGLFVRRKRIVCTSTQWYFEDIQNCEDIISLPSDSGGNPKNNGPSCKSDCKNLGDPINAGNGNNWRVETDYSTAVVPGALRFARTYNSNGFSLDASEARSIGARWTSNWDRRLVRTTLPAIDRRTSQCFKRLRNGQIFCVVARPLPTGQDIAAMRGDGKVYVFRKGAGYVGESDVTASLVALYNQLGEIDGWDYTSASGDEVERYDAEGRLISVTNVAGVKHVLTYSAGTSNDTRVARLPASAPVCTNTQSGAIVESGKLLCVTDHWGRQLNFEYDAKGRVAKMLDAGQRAFLYAYDEPSGGCTAANPTSRQCSASNLTSVTFPDGKSIIYWYNEAALINSGAACTGYVSAGPGYGHLPNSLTGLTDENGARHSNWTYDCQGRATGNALAGDVAKVTIAYGVPDATTDERSNVATWYRGTQANPVTVNTKFGFKMIAEVARNSTVDQPCHDCGPIAAFTFDQYGNVKSTKDWNNVVTDYTFEPVRNLERSRTEAVGTPEQRIITTEWHNLWRRPTRIAEPGRITTFEYDDKGNVRTRTLRATSDSTGALKFDAPLVGLPRIWTYTYNGVSQLETVTSPRKDLVDKTTYTYDTQGNLATVTNAAGQKTTLSDYDADGHPGKITDPNNLVTTLQYNARGKLEFRTSGRELTKYAYDGVGQLTKVTQPDGSSVTYKYDDAHRLTGIEDNLGNTISYTLDLSGNRIGERVEDPAGALARQTVRVFDALGRVKQITGAQQ